MTWPKVALREVLTPTGTPTAVHPERLYPLLGVRLAGKGAFLRETKKGSESAATTLIQVADGDFIYSRLFAWQGAFGLISERLAGSFVSGEFPVYHADPERLDSRYLFYWFQLPSIIKRVEKDCTGTTTLTRNRFKERFFEALKVPLPPLTEQRRIVARLDAAAAAMAARITAASGLEAELAATKAAAFDRITRDAPRLTMAEVAPLVRRPVTIDPDATYPELGVRSFGKGTFHKLPLAGIDVGSKKLFSIEPSDLVFNIVFAWEGAVAVAEASDMGRVGSHRFLSCVPDPANATATFLRYWFLSEEGLLALGRASPGGAGRNRTLGIKALEAICVPVPSLDAQHWFDRLQAKVRAARLAQAAATAELDALLPALLHDAFGDADARD